jgi:hypothetical protein
MFRRATLVSWENVRRVGVIGRIGIGRVGVRRLRLSWLFRLVRTARVMKVSSSDANQILFRHHSGRSAEATAMRPRPMHINLLDDSGCGVRV